MNKNVKSKNLYSNVPPILSSLFAKTEYPWEILQGLKQAIDSLLATPAEEYKVLTEGVLVGENVRIHPSAVIVPPAILGKNTEIRPGAYLRGYVFCGEGCVVGNSTELKHCILMNKVQVPHYNYVGDSILGERSHLGAGSICSNLKSDGKNVVVHGNIDYNTNLRKLGAFLGDGADIGCSCVLNPGTIIGKNTTAYPLTSLRGVYPENSIIKDSKNIIKRK